MATIPPPPPGPPPPPPPPGGADGPPPPPHAHIPVAKGGASLSELLAKRVKRTAAEVEDGNEPVWSVASSQYLQQKSKTGFVGLSNQGATCYLNSLIQTLYMTPELRTALYEWEYNPVYDGPEESSIPLQLQRLFLRLQLGSAAIVETKDLTTSFGWTGGQAFQQHDVQELLRKLFEALDVCLTRGATAIRSNKTASTPQVNQNSTTSHPTDAQATENSAATPPPATQDKNNLGNMTANLVNQLYEGILLDYIRCMECNYARERRDPFFDVPLVVRDIDSVEGALEKYLTPEVLTEDNRWHCDRCGTRVDAFKGLQFARLPYFLTLQLNRFDYDYQTWRRIKLNNKVSFPQQLNMNAFFSAQDDLLTPQVEPIGHVQSNSSQDSTPNQYELYSVMIHSGGAEGGHYYAFVKSFESDKWFKFNDASVSEISSEDICTVFGGAPPKNQASTTSTSGAAPPPPPPVTATASAPKTAQPSSYSTNAYMLLYRLVDPTRNQRVVDAGAIPVKLMDFIAGENAEFERLRAEHQKRLDNVALTVYFDKELLAQPEAEEPRIGNPAPTATEHMGTYTVNVDKHETLATTLQMVYDAGLVRGLSLKSRSCIRLRPFAPLTGTKAPAWLPSSASSTLEGLNFHHHKDVYLEVKSADDIAWLDEEVYYTLGAIKFIAEKNSFEPALPLRISWRATLKDLKDMIFNSPELKPSLDLLPLLNTLYGPLELEKEQPSQISDSDIQVRIFAVDSSANCRELKGDSEVLNEGLRLSDGQCVHIEFVPPGPFKTSLVAAKFDEERHKVQIFYNMFDTANFDHYILIDTRKTLRTLKQEIATALQVTPNDFRMCRNLLSKEFNNLDLTLSAANLYEGSAVCLVRGRPIGVNQIKLKLSILKDSVDDDEVFSTPWTIEIDESATVEELRSIVNTSPEMNSYLVSSGKFADVAQATNATKYLRLREKKANRCASVLFDGDTLKGAMDNLMDGDEVAIQVLDAPDSLLRTQLILVFRQWIPSARQLSPKSFEVIVPRTATMATVKVELSNFIKKQAPFTPAVDSEDKPAATDNSNDIPPQYLGISKPYLFMIKKKDASALSGLNWELPDDVQLTQSPWYLGDGALLLFKDMRDPEHGPSEASNAGSSNDASKPAPREQRLQIHTIYDEPTSISPNSSEKPAPAAPAPAAPAPAADPKQ